MGSYGLTALSIERTGRHTVFPFVRRKWLYCLNKTICQPQQTRIVVTILLVTATAVIITVSIHINNWNCQNNNSGLLRIAKRFVEATKLFSPCTVIRDSSTNHTIRVCSITNPCVGPPKQVPSFYSLKNLRVKSARLNEKLTKPKLWKGEFLVLMSTVGHRSHDPCFNVFLMGERVMTFVAHCTSHSKS